MTLRPDIQKASGAGPFESAIGDEMRGERATMGRSLLDVQRDLRIKAAYIAAIENADPEVFPNPSFIPGYVRSYARYLGMEPDHVYTRFCAESGFEGPASPANPARARRPQPPQARPAGVFRPDFPMAERRRGLPSLPVSAIGSVAVLTALVGVLGYGGWTVLQNIQRVQFAPVEELPLALAQVDAINAPDTAPLDAPELSALASPVAATALADLYRQQELEVPILVPRDGPIAAIDPERVGLLARREAPRMVADAPMHAQAAAQPYGPPPPAGLAAGVAPPEPQLTSAVERPTLTVVAERAAWVRVYLADGTVLFERILETGETWSPPPDVAGPMIWAGNSGSVYVRLGGTLHGPLGSGTRAVRDIVLEPVAIAERFAAVAPEDVPEAIPEAPAVDPSLAQADIAVE